VASFSALAELRVQRYGLFLKLPNFFETFFEKRQKKSAKLSSEQHLREKYNYFLAL
jgi:hypothetical protein